MENTQTEYSKDDILDAVDRITRQFNNTCEHCYEKECENCPERKFYILMVNMLGKR